MKRWNHTFWGLLVASSLAGCSFADGRPWGQVDGRLGARSIEETGALPEGLELERATLKAELFLESTSTSSGGSGGSFDPSNPPPGYTLCHNGHCHSDEGELIPYEEVRAEMNSSGGTSTSTLGSWTTEIDLQSGNRVRLPEIAVDQRTAIDRVRVKVTNLILEGTVQDGGESVPIEAQLGQFELGTLEGIDLAVGPEEPYRQTLEVCTNWSNNWFEQIDVSQLERQEGTIRLTRILNSDATAKLVGAAQLAELENTTCQ